jgi:hypothetical protein
MSAPAGVKIRRECRSSHQYKRLYSKALAPYITKRRLAAKRMKRRLFAVYALYRYEECNAASMGSGRDRASDGKE